MIEHYIMCYHAMRVTLCSRATSCVLCYVMHVMSCMLRYVMLLHYVMLLIYVMRVALLHGGYSFASGKEKLLVDNITI